MSFLEHFVPLQHRNNTKAKFSAILLLRINIILLVYMLVMGVFFLYVDFPFGLYCTGFTVISISLFFLSMRYLGHYQFLNETYFTAYMLTLMTVASLGTGGIFSPFAMWFLTIPAAIFFYVRKSQAKFWVGVMMLCLGLVASSNFLSFSITKSLDTRYLAIVSICNFIIMTLVLIRITMSFRNSYKQVNHKLATSIKALSESNEDLQNFAYIASHDLQTPLKGIHGMVKVLQKHRGDDLDEIETKCLHFIGSNTKRLSNLVEEILTYSRAGKQSGKLEMVDLNELIRAIETQIDAAGVYAQYKVIGTSLPTILGDKGVLFQLFQNVIENGLKYNRSTVPTVIIKQELNNKKHQISFTDNGIGIASKDYDKVFGMFKRVAVSDEFKGTGIGLATCKKIVQQYGGKIWLESVLGEGTTFHIELPILEDKTRTLVPKGEQVSM